MALKFYDKLKHAVRFWLLSTLPTCQQTVETISNSMEQPLAIGDSIKLKLHLWICVWCQWYMEHLHLIRDASRTQAEKAPDVMSGATLSNDARERIRHRLSNQK